MSENFQVQGLYSYLKTNKKFMIVFPSSSACVTRRLMWAITITVVYKAFYMSILFPPKSCGSFAPKLSWMFIRWCIAKIKLLALIVNSTWMPWLMCSLWLADISDDWKSKMAATTGHSFNIMRKWTNTFSY